MNKKIIFFLLPILLFAIVGISVYYYLYQDHRDISSENAEFRLEARAFLTEYQSNIDKSNTKYLDKTIEISGQVTSQPSDSTLVINNGVVCNFEHEINKSQNAEIKIKGRVVGYDDLLEEIQLDGCTETQ